MSAVKKLASEIRVGDAVRPSVPGERCLFGTVVEASQHGATTTLLIKGYNRWNWQDVGVFTYGPTAKVTVPS